MKTARSGRTLSVQSEAILLAAGKGTRLGDLGKRVPKALISVRGEPLLERQLRELWEQGFESVTVNASHLSEQLREFLQARSERDSAAQREALKVTLITEERPLGTAGGVLNACPAFRAPHILVACADVLYPPLAALELLAAHDQSDSSLTIGYYRSTHTEGKGVLGLEGERVTRFSEKESVETHSPAAINAGIYVVDLQWIRRELSSFSSPDGVLDWGRDVFPQALQRGEEILARELSGAAHDVGTLEALREINAQRG